jgi:hypothetical protein
MQVEQRGACSLPCILEFQSENDGHHDEGMQLAADLPSPKSLISYILARPQHLYKHAPWTEHEPPNISPSEIQNIIRKPGK